MLRAGAATTVYCCLKAQPSERFQFYQDCAAVANSIPQANDDSAAEQLCATPNALLALPSARKCRVAVVI